MRPDIANTAYSTGEGKLLVQDNQRAAMMGNVQCDLETMPNAKAVCVLCAVHRILLKL